MSTPTNHTTLKDLRILVGRTEAQVTALRISVECYEGADALMKDRAITLSLLINQLRQQIEQLA